MALPTGYHVQMIVTDANGKLVNVLPVSIANDVQLDRTDNTNIPVTVTNLQELANALGALAFLNSIPDASTSSSGLVTLSNVTDDTTTETTAATTKAVSEVAAVANGAVQNTGDEDIEGVKTFSNGVMIGTNTKITSETDTKGNTVTTFSTTTK